MTENIESPEISHTTDGSTVGSSPGSTGGSTPKYSRSHWTFEEKIKFMNKRFRAKIYKHASAIRSPNIHTAQDQQRAIAFFEKNFPTRSPFACYLRACFFENKKYKRVFFI